LIIIILSQHTLGYNVNNVYVFAGFNHLEAWWFSELHLFMTRHVHLNGFLKHFCMQRRKRGPKLNAHNLNFMKPKCRKKCQDAQSVFGWGIGFCRWYTTTLIHNPFSTFNMPWLLWLSNEFQWEFRSTILMISWSKNMKKVQRYREVFLIKNNIIWFSGVEFE